MNAVVASGENALSFLSDFGVEWDLLISQCLMFVVLSVILYYAMFKPIMKTASERRESIAKGLADAKQAQEKLELCQKQCEEKIVQAGLEAAQILAKTREDSKAMLESAKREASEKASALIGQAKAEIDSERVKMKAELKSEIVGLVVQTAKAVLGDALDENARKKIADSAADKIAAEK